MRTNRTTTRINRGPAGANLRRRRKRHDPMLVLNMSIFNTAGGGWQRILTPFKTHENGAR
jgi:hypothetical protein